MGIESALLAIALLSVAVTRGSYRKLMSTKLNHWWTLAVVLVGHLVILFAPISKSLYDSVGLAILLGTYVFLFGFCAANLNIRGMWIVLTGSAMNAVVIGLNKGMPVSNSGGFVVKESIKHQASSSADLLPWLTDVIPLNFASIAISVGDIIFGIGLIVVCIGASRKEKPVELPNTSEMIETDFELDLSEESGDIEEVEKHAIAVSSSGVIDLDEYELIVEPEVIEPAVSAADEQPRNAPAPMMRSSQGPGRPKSDEARTAKAEKIKERRRHKKWQKTHGLAALPSKEELGYDEESMEIVDIAK